MTCSELMRSCRLTVYIEIVMFSRRLLSAAPVTSLAAHMFDVCCVCVCKQSITAPYEQVYPAEEYDNKDVDDNCKYSVPV